MNFESFETFLVNILVSGVSAAFAKTLMAPVDRMKMILQNQDSALQVLKKERHKYKNAFDIIRRLPSEQGIHSFWRGNMVSIMRYIPLQALNFSFNDFYISLLSRYFNAEIPEQRTEMKFIAGGLAGASSLFLVFPLDFCQTKIITDIGTDGQHAKVKREYNSLTHCVKSVYHRGGIRGYYSGVGVGISGIIVYRSLYFGLFDFVKRLICGEQQFNEKGKPVKMSLGLSFLTAQTVTILAGTISYPWDTAVRRIMVDSGRPDHLKQFKGSWDAVVSIYRQGGFIAFYRGVFSNMFRSTGGALVLVLYDEILHYTNWKKRLKKFHSKDK